MSCEWRILYIKKILGKSNILLDINKSGYIILFNHVNKHNYIKKWFENEVFIFNYYIYHVSTHEWYYHCLFVFVFSRNLPLLT